MSARIDGLGDAAADDLIRDVVALVPSAAHPAVMEALKQDADVHRKHRNVTAAAGSQLARLKAAVMLFFLYMCVLPASIIFAFNTWAILRIRRGSASTTSKVSRNEGRVKPRGTAIVTGGNKTKALHVCRHLSAAGWRVIMVEGAKNWSCCARFSNSVHKFCSVPVPNQKPVEYLKAMAQIGAKEKAMLFVPVSIAQYSMYEALAAELLPSGCHSCTLPAAEVAILNDKIKFHGWAIKRSLSTPAVFPITSHAELQRLNNQPGVFNGQPYLLKSVHYAALNRADLFKLPCDPQVLDEYTKDLDISELQPWLLQQFVTGPEFASYSIIHKGRVVAHADNVAELSCLNYEHVGDQEILEWVTAFAAADPELSGQVCFDFMRNDSNKALYCIECNPRTSTNILAFRGDERLAAAFWDPSSVLSHGGEVMQPGSNSQHSYWLMNEATKLLFNDCLQARSVSGAIQAVQQRLSFMAGGVDAVAEASDPLPFYALHFLQIPVQLLRIMVAGTPWSKVDWCSGKVVCLNGD